jgi:hypothetical protein
MSCGNGMSAVYKLVACQRRGMMSGKKPHSDKDGFMSLSGL